MTMRFSTSFKYEKNRKNKILVFTNGCFDILHRGHVTYLNEAKKLGDILVVGLNTDDSVRRLKGENRPIVSEEDRAFVLKNLKAVDDVVLFREDTPYRLISCLKPDILVKGADYQKEEIVGVDIVEKYGGRVVRINFIAGYSSTNLIGKQINYKRGTKK